MKRFIGNALALIMLGPLVPIYFLVIALEAIVQMLEYAAANFGGPFVRAGEWVQRQFGIDADSDYASWKRRMKDAGKFE